MKAGMTVGVGGDCVASPVTAGVASKAAISGEPGRNANHATTATIELTTTPHNHLLCHHLRAVRRSSMACASKRDASLKFSS